VLRSKDGARRGPDARSGTQLRERATLKLTTTGDKRATGFIKNLLEKAGG